MLFQSISLLALAASTFAAPAASPPSYSTSETASASYSSIDTTSTSFYGIESFSSSSNCYTTVQILHTNIYHWTAALNATRESYSSCSTEAEKAVFVAQLQSQFISLQECVQTAHTTIQKQTKHKGGSNQDIFGSFQDSVQEISYTGQSLISLVGHDVVAPLLTDVVTAVDGLLGALKPVVGGLLGTVSQMLSGLTDALS